jgi:antibiotic biosynthesis monooxygenase (ABM) superfamily enzyme
VIPAGLSPAIEVMPLLGNLFISRFLVAGIIVWLMVYVIMPRYTRAVADWLYR